MILADEPTGNLDSVSGGAIMDLLFDLHRTGGVTLVVVVPVVSVVLVAIVLVLSQALYTVDQRQYAIKFQLGEFIEAKTEAGLYFKIPLVQNVKFYDRRLLTLDAPEVVHSVALLEPPIFAVPAAAQKMAVGRSEMMASIWPLSSAVAASALLLNSNASAVGLMTSVMVL